MSKRCGNCGDMVPDGEKFCPTCGIPLVKREEKRSTQAKKVEDDFRDYVHGGKYSAKDLAQTKNTLTLPTILLALLVLVLAAAGVIYFMFSSKLCSGHKRMAYKRGTGYYRYEDTYYYNQGGSWYQYDEALGWVLADPEESFLEDSGSYYEGIYYNSEYGASNFSSSVFYDPNAGLEEIDDNNPGQNSVNDNDWDLEGDDDW